jgi:serine/threonine protein kinase
LLAQVVPIEEDFEIGEELGKGQFSRVCLCVNKHTLQRKAVKIIEKETMDAEEKEVRTKSMQSSAFLLIFAACICIIRPASYLFEYHTPFFGKP